MRVDVFDSEPPSLRFTVTPLYPSHIDMLALHDLFAPPDPALRQPLTGTAFFPLYSSHYAMAVLVILPHTFILRLSLLPFVLWQAWRCAVRLNFSAGLALSLGVNGEKLNFWNFAYVVRLLLFVYPPRACSLITLDPLATRLV
jgi:hypothetical protein